RWHQAAGIRHQGGSGIPHQASMARSSKSRMSVFQADDSGASPERAAPPNALADERRSFKPEKQVRFLTGAPIQLFAASGIAANDRIRHQASREEPPPGFRSGFRG